MSEILSQVDKLIRNISFALVSALSFLSVITILFFASPSLATNFNDPLVDAADLGDIGLVEKLLKQGQLPDSKGDFGTTALMRAAFRGNSDLIKLLVENGAFINAADSGGETALHLAAKNGHEDAVKALLYYGAFIDVPDKEEWTPLMRATMAKQTEVVKELINKGADVSAVNNINESVLVHAAIAGVPDIAAMIFGSPKANKISKEQQNIALAVAKRKNNENVEKVIEKFSGDTAKETTKLAQQSSPQTKLIEPAIPAIEEPERKYKISANKELPFVPVKQNSPAADAEAQNNHIEIPSVEKALQETGNNFAGTFFIQLGTFKDDHSAEVAWDKALASSPDVLGKLEPVIVEANLSTDPKDVVYRLRAGTMQNKNDADNSCKNLRAKQLGCYVVEITNITLPAATLNQPPSSNDKAPDNLLPAKTLPANEPLGNTVKKSTENFSPANLDKAPLSNNSTAMKSEAFNGSYPKLGAVVTTDSAPLDITPKEFTPDNNLAKQAPLRQNALNQKPEQTVPVNSPAIAEQQALPWLAGSAPVRKVWSLPEEVAATAIPAESISQEMKPETSNIQQSTPDAAYPATNNTANLPSQQQTALPTKTNQTYGSLRQPAQNQPVVAGKGNIANQLNESQLNQNPQTIGADDRSFIENKDEIRNEIQNMKREEFFSKQGVTPPKRAKKEYDDFYKQIKNNSKDTSVSEAVMVPDETYFAGSKPSTNSSSNGGNWLNIYNLPNEAFANDYGVRMFKSDESLGNLQVIVTKSDTGATMRVGPLPAAKSGELCGNVRAGGFGCSVVGDGDAGSPTASNEPTKLPSSQQGEIPFETKSNFELSWINLGTFPSNNEAEYYWMFIKENNADILNSLQYNIEKNKDQLNKSVKLQMGPFNAKQRASQIWKSMRYRNIACLVSD